MLLSTAQVLEDHLASLDLSAVLVSGKAPFGCCYPKSVWRVQAGTTAAPCLDKHAATRKVVCHWILDNQQGPEAPSHPLGSDCNNQDKIWLPTSENTAV